MHIRVSETDEYGYSKNEQRDNTPGETVSPNFAMKAEGFMEFTGS